MISLILYLIFSNPLPAEVVINEVQVSPGDTVEWLELRVISDTFDIYGIKIVSSQDTAIVNIHTTDSVIFIGKNEVTGNLIFNDSEDSIKLLDPYNINLYTFYYSNTLSFSWNTSRTPQPGFSASNFFDVIWDPQNQMKTILLQFYIDSTPTPNSPNDDYGWISGHVYSAVDSTPIEGAKVHAEGLNGFGENTVYTDNNGYYLVYGLGIDLYSLCASKDGYASQCYMEPVQVYPDSVITGIDFYLTPLKVEECKKNRDKSIKIDTFSEFLRKRARYQIFDVMGRKIKIPSKGIYILKKNKNKAKIIFLK